MMKMHKLFYPFLLSLSIMTPLPALANTVALPTDFLENDSANVLYSKAKWNKNLDAGEYDFAQLHLRTGSTFTDLWKFTLATSSDVTVSISDLEIPFASVLSSFSQQYNNDSSDQHGKSHGYSHEHSSSHGSHNGHSSGKLLDNQYLSFSLFDSTGKLLGSAGDGGSISALDLTAGEWYTLTVSGQVKGIFGSAYIGSLNIEPVPLGSTLPLFASALVTLVVRNRKRISA